MGGKGYAIDEVLNSSGVLQDPSIVPVGEFSVNRATIHRATIHG